MHSFIYRHWGKLGAVLILLLVCVYMVYAHGDLLTREHLIAYGKSLPAGALIASFFILPLIGVPVSLFLVLVGIRFGLGWGMAVSAGAIFFHHLIAFHLAHGFFHDPLKRFARKKGRKIPSVKANSVWFTAVFAAVHGPPYAFKLYLLALTDVPFRIYFWIGAPVYILFGFIPVAAAATAVHLDVTWVYIAVAILSLGFIGFRAWKNSRK